MSMATSPTTFTTPDYLTPIDDLLYGARVVDVPAEPTTDDTGAAKTNKYFPGAQQWRFEVKVKKASDVVDGVEEPEFSRVRVSVWSPTRPQIRPKARVRFPGLMVGAVDGNVYFQARGIEGVK